MNKVTQNDIILFNEKYYICHNYSQVARETGFSASTVRKYVDKNYEPPAEKQIFDISAVSSIKPTKEIFNHCSLSLDEKEEIKILWKELKL